MHITDIHYRGDEPYFNSIADQINKTDPDFVCFTGDLVDDKRYLEEALKILQRIQCPLFGIPGNHEYWCGIQFNEISRIFSITGGSWLVNSKVRFGNGDLEIIGIVREEYKSSFINYSVQDAGETYKQVLKSLPGETAAEKRLLLIHYPAFAEKVLPEKFDLILAGHSHGGQVRLPFVGGLVMPYEVDKYEKGLYETKAGTLYVNPGIGVYGIPIRLFCRPEITVLDI